MCTLGDLRKGPLVDPEMKSSDWLKKAIKKRRIFEWNCTNPVFFPPIISCLAFRQRNKPLMSGGLGRQCKAFILSLETKRRIFLMMPSVTFKASQKLSIDMINYNHLGNCIVVLVGIYLEQRLIHTYCTYKP